MSTCCADPSCCIDGNCIGCQNGKIWCQDPRCFPYCPGDNCNYPEEHDFAVNILMTVIVMILLAILFVIWFAYGPSLFEQHDDHERANVLVPSNIVQ